MSLRSLHSPLPRSWVSRPDSRPTTFTRVGSPPGTQNGQKLRIRGRGLPQRSGPAGDLIVVARIEVPARITEEERKLWTQLGDISAFKPRE